MKKNAIILTLLTVVAGVAAFLLRRRELATVFGADGLAERGAPLSIILMILCLLVVIVLIVLSVRMTAGVGVRGGYAEVFHVEGLVPVVVSAVLGAAMIAAAFLNYRAAAVGGTRAVVEGAVGILAALAGVAGFALAVNARRKSGGCALPAVLVTLFVCFFILVTYKKRASDPVLLDYMYDFIALCLSALSTLFIAGFAFDRASPRKALWVCFAAAFFCFIGAADSVGQWTLVFYIFLIVYQLMHGAILAAAFKAHDPLEAEPPTKAEEKAYADVLAEFEDPDAVPADAGDDPFAEAGEDSVPEEGGAPDDGEY
jgi:hypothetical protein